ncbi:type IX secretion system membrane protein PorP/SprF [Cryomorpha ignava]|uniref:Type IX secretion system membrane protein PorP/SprF n=1 Tax=Cryomorpha ignava TaxID=101383 RepID=A0A7K3WRM6_9FLAO|nr:PorP/SprF family type IX secretion system membrane protein [Cryomorpha ignava]NEN24134.1 type IX secretion system membrane protein PorP/SprF [Cryomorpha ignava]
MKKNLNIIPTLLIGLVMTFTVSQKISAQDAQISQFDAAPVMFNPANTGMLKFTDMRIAALYRTQWSSLSTSFNTFAMSFDMAASDRIGLGAVFVNTDEANIINTSNFLLSGAYQVTDPNQTKYMITTGVQLGLLYKRVNTNGMIFDSQFDGRNFDGDLPSMESFTRTSRFMVDANMGVSYKSTDRTKKINPFADAAVFHITTPNESFIGEQKSKLPMRWMGNVGARIEVNRDVLIEPSVIYNRQRESSQFQPNLLAYYTVSGTPYQVIGGFSYRTEDAVIIHAGVRHNSNIFRISYDINTSGLSDYSNNRGALEFTVIYRPGRRSSRAIY